MWLGRYDVNALPSNPRLKIDVENARPERLAFSARLSPIVLYVYEVKSYRRLRAFFLAPMATLLCAALLATIESAFREIAGVPTVNDPSTAVLATFGLILGVPLLYAVSALVGVPLVWWLEKHNSVAWRHFALAGFFCGLALAGVLSLILWSPKYDDYLATLGILSLLLPGPVIFGFVSCWYIGYRTYNKQA